MLSSILIEQLGDGEGKVGAETLVGLCQRVR
jgi:hypothetical protein